jgi:hypothetical protein
LRYLYAFISIFLMLAASAAAGSFTAEMDVDTYVDRDNASQSFSDSDLLWTSSQGGESTQEVYLSFINVFGSEGIFSPDQIESATLTLEAADVNTTGKITAYYMHGATLDTATWDGKDDYDADTYSDPVEISGTGSYTIDVTDIIQKAVETCSEGCPYSIVLVADDDASVAFFSSESHDGSGPTLEYTTAD